MNVTGITQLATSMAETDTQQAVSTAVLKKAQDIDISTATALIQGLPGGSSSQNLPAHLGNSVNTSA